MYLRIECRFHDFFPILRIQFYPVPEFDYEKQLELKIEKAWDISQEELEDIYYNKDWESCYQKFRIITGFTARIMGGKNTSVKEIEGPVRKWIKDLVEYIIAPTVMVKPNFEIYPGNHIIIDTKPKNIENMRPPHWEF